MNPRRKASGFACPKCQNAESQTVTGHDIVRILELSCDNCGFTWAVERGHETGFRNPEGKVL